MSILNFAKNYTPAGWAYQGGKKLFGSDMPDRSGASRRRQQILDDLRTQYERAEGRSPTESASFQTSMTKLREQTEREAERDAAQAAARGLEGSQFEVAQDAVRARTMARGQQDALRRAEQTQNRRQQQRLGTLMSGLADQDTNFWRRKQQEAQRRRQILGALGQAGRGAALAAGGA